MKKMILAAGLALAASCAHAQSESATSEQPKLPPPPPTCEDALYRQFDFWAGVWDVYNPKGKQAGVNTITIEENGCLLVERWRGAGGGTGQSYNFVDYKDGKWRQLWVSAGAVIDYKGGLNDDGEMVLEGEIAYRNGRTAPFRGTWTPNDDGSVTQYFQEYDSENETWKDWFTGLYKPQKESD